MRALPTSLHLTAGPALRALVVLAALAVWLPPAASAAADPPTWEASVSIAGGAAYSNHPDVTVDLAATSSAGPVTGYKLTGPLGNWPPDWQPFAPSVPWVFAAGQGERTLRAMFVDDMGNESPVVTDTIVYDTEPPVTRDDVLVGHWYPGHPSVTLSASDETSGVESVHWLLDGSAGTGSQVDVGSDGEHTLEYWAVDLAGNEELPHHSVAVWSDATPPVTTDDFRPAWRRAPFVIRLDAHDDTSGVVFTGYRIDSQTEPKLAAWVRIAVPADHSYDGEHRFAYASVDAAGNAEAEHLLTLQIDSRRPVARAPYRAAVRSGGVAKLRFAVADRRPDGGLARVTIRVFRGRQRVMSLHLGQCRVDRLLTARFRCRLAPGEYGFAVSARDLAGNRGATPALNRLVVRR